MKLKNTFSSFVEAYCPEIFKGHWLIDSKSNFQHQKKSEEEFVEMIEPANCPEISKEKLFDFKCQYILKKS